MTSSFHINLMRKKQKTKRVHYNVIYTFNMITRKLWACMYHHAAPAWAKHGLPMILTMTQRCYVEVSLIAHYQRYRDSSVLSSGGPKPPSSPPSLTLHVTVIKKQTFQLICAPHNLRKLIYCVSGDLKFKFFCSYPPSLTSWAIPSPELPPPPPPFPPNKNS